MLRCAVRAGGVVLCCAMLAPRTHARPPARAWCVYSMLSPCGFVKRAPMCAFVFWGAKGLVMRSWVFRVEARNNE
jgi:hypothetical protein